jgi:hypothetical protein
MTFYLAEILSLFICPVGLTLPLARCAGLLWLLRANAWSLSPLEPSPEKA